MARWQEELNIVREEMFRCLRFFENEERAWLTRATEAEGEHRAGAVVYSRRYVNVVMSRRTGWNV